MRLQLAVAELVRVPNVCVNYFHYVLPLGQTWTRSRPIWETAKSVPKASRVSQSNRLGPWVGRVLPSLSLDCVIPFYASCPGPWPAFFSDFYYSATRVPKIEMPQANDNRRVGQSLFHC